MKFDPEDILVIGDSFCAERELESDWPILLVKKLTGKATPPRGAGLRGCHWWSYRRIYFNELAKHVPKVVVVCHTDATRIPSDSDLPLNAGSVINADDGTPLINREAMGYDLEKEVAEAALMYFCHLHTDSFAAWANRQWQKELCESLKSYQVPYVLHLHCFPPWWENTETHIGKPYALDYGMTDSVSLYNRLLENKQLEGNRNHFTVDANSSIAESLYRTIKYGYSNGVCQDFHLLAHMKDK